MMDDNQKPDTKGAAAEEAQDDDMTEEEAQALEDRLMNFRNKQAETEQAERDKERKPLIDLMGSKELAHVTKALAELAKAEALPDIEVYLNSIAVGLKGLNIAAGKR